MKEEFILKQFPKSAKYEPEWLLRNHTGPCSVWLTEFLMEKMDLKPGMRILDMGCGMGMSSVFLAKEFDVTVFANDQYISLLELDQGEILTFNRIISKRVDL